MHKRGPTCAGSPTNACRRDEARFRPRAAAAARRRSPAVPRPHPAPDPVARRAGAQDGRGGAGARNIARDATARARFLAYARAADQLAVRTRLLNVARDLGWLSADDRWEELALMLGELQGRTTVGVGEVGLACTLNEEQRARRCVQSARAARQPGRRRAARRGSRLPGQCRGTRAHADRAGQHERGGRPDRTGLPAPPADHRRRRIAPGRRAPSPAWIRPTPRCVRSRRSAGTTCPIAKCWTCSRGSSRQTPSASVQAAIAGILLRADLRSISGSNFRAQPAREPPAVRRWRQHDRRADSPAASALRRAPGACFWPCFCRCSAPSVTRPLPHRAGL